MAAPQATNGREHDKWPLSALPADIMDSRSAEKPSWPWPEGNRSPISRVILIPRERRLAKVEHEGCRAEIREEEDNGRAQSP